MSPPRRGPMSVGMGQRRLCVQNASCRHNQLPKASSKEEGRGGRSAVGGRPPWAVHAGFDGEASASCEALRLATVDLPPRSPSLSPPSWISSALWASRAERLPCRIAAVSLVYDRACECMG